MPTTKASIMNQLNRNFARLKPVGIREFDAQASAVPGIVKLTLGEPDFNVPDAMKQAAIDSITSNDSHYAPAVGTAKLRAAIADFLKDRYQLDYDPNGEIAVTIGATEGIYAALSALINPGDEILVATPTFPLYMAVTTMLGGQPVEIDTSDHDFVLTPDQLKETIAAHPRAKALILNYPSNPTGVTYSAQQVEELAMAVKNTDLVVIADEIYSELVYDGQHTSIAKFIPEQTRLPDWLYRRSPRTDGSGQRCQWNDDYVRDRFGHGSGHGGLRYRSRESSYPANEGRLPRTAGLPRGRTH